MKADKYEQGEHNLCRYVIVQLCHTSEEIYPLGGNALQ
jgi:hypothetical protein